MTLPIKLCFENDIRRVSLEELSYSSITAAVQSLFNVQGKYKLQYYDREGELVDMSTDGELQAALAEHSGSSSVFRVHVVPLIGNLSRPPLQF